MKLRTILADQIIAVTIRNQKHKEKRQSSIAIDPANNRVRKKGPKSGEGCANYANKSKKWVQEELS